MAKKYIIGIVVVLVVVGLYFFMNSQPMTPSNENTGATNPANVQNPPAANGNPDDATAAIIMSIGAADETPTLENDPSILAENDQAISDFGKSFDGSQF